MGPNRSATKSDQHGPFNTVEHEEWTSPSLGLALEQLPDLKRARKILIVDHWLTASPAGSAARTR